MKKRKKYNLYVWRSLAYGIFFGVFIWGILGCGHISDGTNEPASISGNAGAENEDVSEDEPDKEAREMSDELFGELSEQQGQGAAGGEQQVQGDMSGGGGMSEGNMVSGQDGSVLDGSAGAVSSDGSAIVAQGALSVSGTQLVDASGNSVQLKGISTHGLAWYPDYVNEDCFLQLKEEWGANVVRLAMYTAEYGGYCTGGNQNALKELVRTGVECAVECGLYVIIDWHILSDGNPNTYLSQAKDFFAEMSDAYKDYGNVIYEICNEPNGGTSWSEVKQYAEQVIEVIRENDKKGIILVGTPNWSQYVDQAAADPIVGYDNIMYTLHYYAATHKDGLRSTMVKAVEDGLPIFVSEYGICDASGNGAIDESQANQWITTLDEYKISYVAWNLSNKSETSAVIKSSCSKVKGFTADDLSNSGKWLYDMLRSAGSVSEANSFAGSEEDGTSGVEGNIAGYQVSASGTNQGDPFGNHTDMQGNGQGDVVGSYTDAQGGGEGDGAGNYTDAQGSGQGNLVDGFGIAADVINSWVQGNETYYQYTLTITNDSGEDQNSWTINISFNNDIVLNNGWNGHYQVNGNVLTISAMDYNGFIAAGGSIENIGFILQSTDNLTILETGEL